MCPSNGSVKRLPSERSVFSCFGPRIRFRAEAFNAFNNVNWDNPSSLTLANPTTFGQITAAAEARVIQFALRYEF